MSDWLRRLREDRELSGHEGDFALEEKHLIDQCVQELMPKVLSQILANAHQPG